MVIGLLAVSLFAAHAGSAADIPVKRNLPAVEKPMMGIIWSCGSEKPTQDTEMWLADVDQNLHNNPYISGILVSAKWNIVNPEKDNYNWNSTDRLVAMAKKYNKSYKIKMQPGVTTKRGHVLIGESRHRFAKGETNHFLNR
jgi:GH35 family endo-1,4-beta-xylanase